MTKKSILLAIILILIAGCMPPSNNPGGKNNLVEDSFIQEDQGQDTGQDIKNSKDQTQNDVGQDLPEDSGLNDGNEGDVETDTSTIAQPQSPTLHFSLNSTKWGVMPFPGNWMLKDDGYVDFSNFPNPQHLP